MIGDHTPFHDHGQINVDVLPGTLILGKVFHNYGYGPPRTWLIVGQSTYVLAPEMKHIKYDIKYVSGLLTMGQSAKFIETMLVFRADVVAGNVVLFEPEERSSK